MRINRYIKRFARTFHEVSSATAMHMQFNATRHYICTLHVDTLRAHDRELGILYCKNLATIYDNTAVI